MSCPKYPDGVLEKIIIKLLEKMRLIKTSLEVEEERIKRKVHPLSWVELLPEDVKS